MTQLFQNVLTASFHGSIVIAVVLLLRPLLRKAPRKFICLLWLMAGLRLLIPLEISSPASLQPEPVTNVPTLVQSHVQGIQPGGVPEFVISDAPVQEAPVVQQPQVPQVQPETSAPEVKTEPVKRPINWMKVAAWSWLAVMGIIALFSLGSYLVLRRRLREAIRVKEGIWVCDRINTAFILGYIRPRIYIPMGISRSNCKHILAHERTHLEKGDHWFKLIGFIALAVHWFNPLVWLAYILLCKDIEIACDERVVQFMEIEERKSYSAALVACSARRAHYTVCPVAFGEVSVKERVRRVLKYKKPSFWISVVSVAALAFVAVCFLTSPKDSAEIIPETTEAAETVAAGETAPASVQADPEHDLSDMMENISDADYVDPYGNGLALYTYNEGPSGLGFGISFDHRVDYDEQKKIGRGITFTEEYWLEREVDGAWEKVEPEVRPSFDDLTYSLSEAYYQTKINWRTVYGDLYDGHFRLGKNLDVNGAACTYYAEFYIMDNDPEKEPKVAAIVDRVHEALAEIAGRECVHVVQSSEDHDVYGDKKQQWDGTWSGSDFISINSGEGMNAMNGQSAFFEGAGYTGYEGQWYKAGEQSESFFGDQWTQGQRLDGYHVTVIGHGTISDSRDTLITEKIALKLDRMQNGFFTRSYRNYYFDDEGRLTQIDDTTYYHEQGVLCKDHTITELYQAERSNLTTQLEAIRANAGNHTYEELDQLMREKDFDQDFMLGAGSFVWNQEDWAYRIGGQEGSATATGMMVDHEYCGGESKGTLYTQGAFWIERFENEKWTRVSVPAGNALPSAEAKLIFDNTNGLTAPTRMRCDWTDSYGTLEPGFYRVAQNYKLTAGGKESIKTCYAKFRVYDPNGELYLTQVRQGMEDLLNRDSYCIEVREDYMKLRDDGKQDIRYESIWKRPNGDYFESYDLEDDDHVPSYSILLNGKGYFYSGEPNDGWEYVGHFNRESFEFWLTSDFDMYDSCISTVGRTGNVVTVYHDGSDYPRKFEYTFDDAGRLIAGQVCNLGDNPVLTEAEFKVRDVTEVELDSIFSKYDITKPATFSFAEDEKQFAAYENNKTSGFQNTSPVTISTAQEAEERAKNDCTLLPFEDENGYHEGGWNLTKAFFDADAQMWKVEFTFSQGGVYQAVYMTADGVTTNVIS